VLLAALLLLSGCGRAEGHGPIHQASASTLASEPLARVEAVKRADELALAASKSAGARAAELNRDAARIRAQIWRQEGREADALEAIELYRAAAASDWEGACAASVELALVEGERTGGVEDVYLGLYEARRDSPPADCLERIDAALVTLAAFRPSPAKLAALEGAAPSASSAAGASVAEDTDDDVVLPPVSSLPSTPSSITKIEHFAAKDAARVAVFMSHPTRFEVGSLAATAKRGPRLYVDITEATYHGDRAIEGEGLVEGIRVGAQTSGTRVVLDLAEAVERKIFYLPEPFRLIIDVRRGGAGDVASEPRGARVVQRMVLDPGHGGHDPGATGAVGLREKDVALDIAHRAAPLIARELGISTLLTRDGDTFVPLDERVARANAFGADLFVSIHCNASENHASRGVTTFVLDASRDDLAVRVAARENAASPAAAVELANALSRVLDPQTTSRSSTFAGLLQRAAMASLAPTYAGTQDLGVRSAGFYVLAGAQMPAVLFETAFISHPSEERRLDSADYRQKLADSIVNAVRAYRDGL
jgi:N-acetylmuramoyl-L-alanine amidase